MLLRAKKSGQENSLCPDLYFRVVKSPNRFRIMRLVIRFMWLPADFPGAYPSGEERDEWCETVTLGLNFKDSFIIAVFQLK